MALYCTEGQYSVKEGIKTNHLSDCVSSLFQIYQALFLKEKKPDQLKGTKIISSNNERKIQHYFV